jgi:bacterioferritin
MKGDKKIIKHLNTLLKGELTAVNQYFLHSRLLENWGVTKMAKHEYKESIEEMHHADTLIKRILLLGGLPNMQELGKLYIGENVKEVLEGDLRLETEGSANYRTAIKDCEEAGDYGTRDLLTKILIDEEGHHDHLMTQLELIGTIGLERYILLQSEAEGGE